MGAKLLKTGVMRRHRGLQSEVGVWTLLSRELVLSERLTPFCRNNQGEERKVETPFVPDLLLKIKGRDTAQAWTCLLVNPMMNDDEPSFLWRNAARNIKLLNHSLHGQHPTLFFILRSNHFDILNQPFKWLLTAWES